MKFFVLLIFALFLADLTSAQSPVTAAVNVKIVDEKSTGVDGATVSLLNAKDSSLQKINITEKDGTVLFEQVKGGKYLLAVTFTGYKKVYTQPFLVSGGNLQIPDIHIEPLTRQLNEVTVKESKPFIERQFDRVVINVGNSIVSTGSSALEVLSRSPGVLVNQNDDISMKGKQGVIVMIDGKPTYLSSADLANLLRSTSASAIDKIELITNPSAKFEAAGSAGIINIKLKKDQRYGTNGTLSLSAGQGVYGKLNDGFSLNYRNNKVNLFGNYNYTYRTNFNHLVLNRRFLNNDGSLNGAYLQDNYLKVPLHGHLLKAGMDYAASKNTTIGVVFTGQFDHYQQMGNDNSDVLDSTMEKVSNFKTINTASDHLKNYAANVNFKHTIDTAGGEITADLDFATYGKNSIQSFVTSYFNPDGSVLKPDDLLNDNQNSALDIYSVKADYVLPLRKQSRLEAGIKSSYVRADNDLNFYNVINNVSEFDTTKSNHFIYTENINAGYINYNKSFKQYKIQMGVRAEQTIAKGNQLITDSKFSNSYIQFFPSFVVSDKVDEQNELSLSVGRRIDRPTYKQLNPFKFYLDPSTYVEGNPYLRPQLTWSGEVDYTFKQKYTVSFTYSNTGDNITSVLIPNATDNRITIQTDLNLARNYYYDLSFTLPVDVTSWWTSTNNLNTYYSNYSGNLANTPLNKGAFAFDANSNNSFTISKLMTAELNGVFTSGNVYGYLYVNHTLELSAGVQRKILKGKGTLKLNITDFLKTNNLVGTTSIDNYNEVFHRHIESRIATLAFTYRFGNNKVAPSRRRAGGAEEEKKRAG